MYILSMILLIFFAIIGLCAFITGLIGCAYHGDGELVMLLRRLTADNAEGRVRAAISLSRRSKGGKVICVCEQDNPARDICVLMQKEYPYLEIVTPDELRERI